MDLAILDGTVLPASDATIPITDEGLLRGDGVFEVIRLYAGVPHALAAHLERMASSAANLRLELSPMDVRADVEALLAAPVSRWTACSGAERVRPDRRASGEVRHTRFRRELPLVSGSRGGRGAWRGEATHGDGFAADAERPRVFAINESAREPERRSQKRGRRRPSRGVDGPHLAPPKLEGHNARTVSLRKDSYSFDATCRSS